MNKLLHTRNTKTKVSYSVYHVVTWGYLHNLGSLSTVSETPHYGMHALSSALIEALISLRQFWLAGERARLPQLGLPATNTTLGRHHFIQDKHLSSLTPARQIVCLDISRITQTTGVM